MAERDEICAFLDALLEPGRFQDFTPNGLQVVGAAQVDTVALAVSPSLEVFERAAAAGAQLLLLHHGLFWRGDDQRVRALERRRLEALFRADLSLVAYHLPLDAHPEVGNNALLMELLGVGDGAPFGDLGRGGTLPAPLTSAELAGALERALGRAPLVLPGGPEPIRSVGVVTGSAGRLLRDAADHGLDCFITGEPREESAALAVELGVTYVAAGHYATETLGVRRLGERLEGRFGVRAVWLPVDNPV